MTKKDGGQAFPRPTYSGSADKDGMSLRDWFAGQSLNGLLASAFIKTDTGSEGFAKIAYGMADALIAERDKETNND